MNSVENLLAYSQKISVFYRSYNIIQYMVSIDLIKREYPF